MLLYSRNSWWWLQVVFNDATVSNRDSSMRGAYSTRIDSISSVATTASSRHLGFFWQTAKATSERSSKLRKRSTDSFSFACSSSSGNARSASVHKLSAKSPQVSSRLLRHVWNSAAYKSLWLSGSKRLRRVALARL